ncbi:DUF1735 domain-containing protein [Bacteroides sp. AN502(2024)]|uniref:DUF1735 domain-containing protein n=1 Tax=Bacteroides sp. AN502(2024) TaxID=3160599 RepID=UPI003519482C
MKKLIYSFLFLGAITALGGCKEDSYEDLIPEQYDKILYLKTYGQQTLELFDDGSQVDYSLTVVKTGSNPSATAQAKVDIMSQAEIDKDVRYQGNNYKVLSSACYTYKSEPLELTSADAYKLVKMKLSPATILEEIAETKDENPNYVYIIPFRLSSPNDQVNQDKKDLILKLNVTKLGIYFKKGSQQVNLNTVTGDEWAFEAEMAMVSGVQNTWNFTAPIEIDRSEEALNAYNTANNTAYSMVPEAAIVNLSEAVFEAGNNEAAAAIRIKRAGLAKGYTYLVPLKLKPITEIGTISVSEKLHYIILEYPLDPEADRIELTTSSFFDVYGWHISSDYGNMIDNNNATIFETQYWAVTGNTTYGTPLDVRIGKEVRSVMFEYTTRNNGSTNPQDISLWASNEDEATTNSESATWFKLGDVTDVPARGEGYQTYSSKVFTSTQPFKYLRIAVKTGNEPVDGTGPSNGCWGMAELKIWAN